MLPRTTLKHFFPISRVLELLKCGTGCLPRFHLSYSQYKLFRRTFQTASGPSLAKSINPLERRNFARVNEEDRAFFEKTLGRNRVLTEASDLEPYNNDWMKAYKGSSPLLLRTRTTSEVSAIISYCNERNLAICPQAGNTGLVGGSVPVFDEIILSTSLMNKVLSIDPISGITLCEAGCVLETLDTKLSEHGLMVPLDLGARGTCQIGGNVSTNAGGLRFSRYGSLHGNVLGLEVVLADGAILDAMSSLRKDNTGYDIKQLFIGSEGTLGVITKVAMVCPRRSSSINVAFLGCDTFDDLLKTFVEAKRCLGEILSAFELIDQESLKATQQHFNMKCPIEPITRFSFYILMETSGSNESHDVEKLNHFVESVLNLGIVKDGGIYSQQGQIKNVWSIRESITAATLRDGYVYKYDISLPLNCLYDLVPVLRHRLGPKITRCNGFGHIGDGNIHINVSTKEYDEDVHKSLEPFVFEWISQQKGSISAEHGIGLQKRDYIHYSKSKGSIAVMKRLKDMFDPKGILNPYKVIRPDNENH